MIIKKGTEYDYAIVWPFINDEKEMHFSKRFTITKDGRVFFDGQTVWTRDQFFKYVAELTAGGVEAFILAEQVKTELLKKKESKNETNL